MKNAVCVCKTHLAHRLSVQDATDTYMQQGCYGLKDPSCRPYWCTPGCYGPQSGVPTKALQYHDTSRVAVMPPSNSINILAIASKFGMGAFIDMLVQLAAFAHIDGSVFNNNFRLMIGLHRGFASCSLYARAAGGEGGWGRAGAVGHPVVHADMQSAYAL